MCNNVHETISAMHASLSWTEIQTSVEKLHRNSYSILCLNSCILFHEESTAKKDVRKQHADSRPASEPASEQTKTKREQSRGSSDETSKRRRVEEEIGT